VLLAGGGGRICVPGAELGHHGR